MTANDYTPEESPGIVLAIARYHRNSQGWNDIGYQFLVDKYGQIFEGRAGGIDQAVVGAQAQGWNSTSTGIACLGDFTSIAQTPEGMDALARLIGWKLSVHGVPTTGEVTVVSAGGETNRYPAGTPVTFQRISGHRDGNNTSCPGNLLYAQLEQLRTAAAQFAGPASGITIYAPKEVRGVTTIEISGSLRFPDGSSADGAALTVEYLPAVAGAAWRSVATAVASFDGSWRASAELRGSGSLRAVFAGDSTRGAARLAAAQDHRPGTAQPHAQPQPDPARQPRAGARDAPTRPPRSGSCSTCAAGAAGCGRAPASCACAGRLQRVRAPARAREVPRDRAGRRHQAPPHAQGLLIPTSRAPVAGRSPAAISASSSRRARRSGMFQR